MSGRHSCTKKKKKHSENKTKMFISNFFSNTFLIFNFLRFWLCILLQRLFYYGSEAIGCFILLKYCVNTFDFSLATYLDLVLTKKNWTKLSFIQCTVPHPPNLGLSPKIYQICLTASINYSTTQGKWPKCIAGILCR